MSDSLENLINAAVASGEDPATFTGVPATPAGTAPATTTTSGAFDFLVDVVPQTTPAQTVAPTALTQAAPAAPAFDYASAIAAEQSRAAAAEQQLAYYRGQAEAAAAMMQQRQQPAAAPEVPAQNLDLTPEEAIAYAESMPVLQKLAMKAAQQAINAAGLTGTAAQITALNKQITDQQAAFATQQAQTREMDFTGRMLRAVPDLPEFSQSTDWQSYLKDKAPMYGAGQTNDSVIRALAAHGDVAAIAEHVKYVKQRSTTTVPATTQPKKLASPIGSGGTAIPPGSMGASQQISVQKVIGNEGLVAMRKAGKLTNEGFAAAQEALFNSLASGVATTA